MYDRCKFRAYGFNEMRYDIQNDADFYFYFDIISDYIPMQCTGLKDRNGTLIYEGDIVEVIPDKEYAVIEWNNDTARFDIHLQTQRICTDFDNYYSYELEVIGNIYENPELLKEVEDVSE